MPLVYGGKQEIAIRPGTENTAGIIDYGKSSSTALKNIRKDWEYVSELNR